jgi:hypothetical protein
MAQNNDGPCWVVKPDGNGWYKVSRRLNPGAPPAYRGPDLKEAERQCRLANERHNKEMSQMPL